MQCFVLCYINYWGLNTGQRAAVNVNEKTNGEKRVLENEIWWTVLCVYDRRVAKRMRMSFSFYCL